MKEHHEIITGVDEDGKKAWMERFERDWASAVEVDELSVLFKNRKETT